MGSCLIEARRRLLLETPHLETSSGALVNFTSPAELPLEELRVNFSPVQTGSGDPSPTNVRPISGRMRVEVRMSGSPGSGTTVIGLSWSSTAGTVYGGYVDLVSGELVEMYEIIYLSTLAWRKRTSSAPYIYSSEVSQAFLTQDIPASKQLCNVLPVAYTKSMAASQVGYLNLYRYGPSTPTGQNLYLAFDDISDLSDFEAWLSDHTVNLCYRRATNVDYQLPTQQIKSLRGVNNIRSNAGDVTVKYWTH